MPNPWKRLRRRIAQWLLREEFGECVSWVLHCDDQVRLHRGCVHYTKSYAERASGIRFALSALFAEDVYGGPKGEDHA